MALLENYASNLSKGASNNASNLPRAHHWMYGMSLINVNKDELRILEYSIEAEEPSIEWEFREEVSSSDEKRIRREEPELLDGNQFRIIGEIMRNDLPQQQNSERDIDMFIKRHIFSCFDTILDSHFGEVVSKLQGIVEQKL
ncbi:unnamed protein product [Rhizophagus irregularis]|nr:unnamed protein product [Rhizophagus irregularis]